MNADAAEEPAGMRPWRFVVWFGAVSLLADFVYEGARSVTGPLLASLGASSLVVGVVTGAGEAAALGLRLVSGPLADRTRRFWGLAIAGYALTVVSVPLLGVVGSLWAACALVIGERVGKAVRSPAKDTLLSHEDRERARGEGHGIEVPESEGAEDMGDGDGDEEREPPQVCGDHDAAAVPAAVRPQARVHPEQQMGQPCRGSEVAHLSRVGVDDSDGDERDGEAGDLVAEAGHGLRAPVAAEGGIAQQADGFVGSLVGWCRGGRRRRGVVGGGQRHGTGLPVIGGQRTDVRQEVPRVYGVGKPRVRTSARSPYMHTRVGGACLHGVACGHCRSMTAIAWPLTRPAPTGRRTGRRAVR